MGKKAPVGTVRQWSSGLVIKAHENIPGKSGWIPYNPKNEFEELTRKLDEVSNRVAKIFHPVSGEKFLDHELEEFFKRYFKEEQEILWPIHPHDFKRYAGFYNIGKYSFSSELGRRSVEKKLAIENRIAEVMVERLREKYPGQELSVTAHDLPAEEKREIRRMVEEEYKNYEEDFKITEEFLRGIEKTVDNTLAKTREAFHLPLKKKAKYDKIVNTMNRWVGSKYLGFKKVKQEKENLLRSLKEFDNYGLEITLEGRINTKFNNFLTKFSKEIAEELKEEQLSKLGTTLDAPTEEFYDKLNKYLESGGEFPMEAIKSRFNIKFNKELSGEWDKLGADVLKSLESVIDNLPLGHFVNNDQVTGIYNKDTSASGYAYYEPDAKVINFSKDAIESVSKTYGLFSQHTELEFVLSHEIGHAVSQKLGKDKDIDYKRFVVSCGWTYQDPETTKHSTGGMDKIPRTGSNSGTRLLTDYAEQSPEEAFAEYYSFYHIYQKEVDAFLKSKDPRYLVKDKEIIPESNSFTAEPPAYLTPEEQREVELVQRQLNRLNIDINKNTSVKFIPTKNFPDIKGIDKKIISRHIKAKKPLPVLVVNTFGKQKIVGNKEGVVISRYLKKPVPVISISQELYDKLSSYAKHLSLYDHILYNLGKVEFKGQRKNTIEEGVYFASTFISTKKIRENYNRLKRIRDIYWKDQLIKALEILEKAFNEGKITEEEYFTALEKASKYGPGKKKIQVKVNRGGKVFYRSQEVGSSVDNNTSLKETYLKNILKITQGKQKEYFEWEYNNAQTISIDSFDSLSKPIQDKLNELGSSFEKKQCYQNAAQIVFNIPNSKYCEGYISFKGIPIEHAWVEIEGKYFDPTAHYLFENKFEASEYLLIAKLNSQQLEDSLSNFGYGGGRKYAFLRNIKKSLTGLVKSFFYTDKHFKYPIMKSEKDIIITDTEYPSVVEKIIKDSKQLFGNVIVYRDGKILMLLRPEFVEFKPKKWCLPGGHIDEREDVIDGAIRELEEETGIKAPKHQVSLAGIWKTKDNNGIFYYKYYLENLDDIIILDNDEHFKARWIGPEELDLLYENGLLMSEQEYNLLKEECFPKYHHFKIIEKAFNEGKVSEEVFFKALEVIKKEYAIIDTDIVKAAKQVAQIGEIREWNGQKMQKQADGSWKPVTKDKESGEEDSTPPAASQQDNNQQQQKLEEYAKQTETEKLKEVVSEPNSDPELKQAAMKELENRGITDFYTFSKKLKDRVGKWHKEQIKFYQSGELEPGSESRKSLGDLLRKKKDGIIKGIKHELREWKIAAVGLSKFFSGRISEISEHELKAIKSLAIHLGLTVASMALTGGIGAVAKKGVFALSKGIVLHFFEHAGLTRVAHAVAFAKGEQKLSPEQALERLLDEVIRFIEVGNIDENDWLKIGDQESEMFNLIVR